MVHDACQRLTQARQAKFRPKSQHREFDGMTSVSWGFTTERMKSLWFAAKA